MTLVNNITQVPGVHLNDVLCMSHGVLTTQSLVPFCHHVFVMSSFHCRTVSFVSYKINCSQVPVSASLLVT